MTAAAKPWMKFYPQDWRSDEKLRMCSLAARGLWMEMLAIMHRSEKYGQLLISGKIPTDAQLAVQVGAMPTEVSALLQELCEAEVYSRTGAGVIYSRRMTRDAKKAETARKFGAEGGNPKLTTGYTRPGFIYLMGVRQDGAYKVGASTNPTNRLKKIRAQYRGQDINVLDQWAVDDMGASEADLHGFLTRTLFKEKAGEWFFLCERSVANLREKMRTYKGPEKGGLNTQRPEARDQIDKLPACGEVAHTREAPARTGLPAHPPWPDADVIEAAGFAWPLTHEDRRQLQAWADDGIDRAATVIPVIRRVAERQQAAGQPPKKLRYFDQAVREDHAEEERKIAYIRDVATRPKASGGGL